MLRHTVTLNHSPLNPRECVLWEEMRQKQYDKLHRTGIFDIKKVRVHTSPSLFFYNVHTCVFTPPVSSLICRPNVAESSSFQRAQISSLSACEGIVVADTEPAAFPANRIREAAQTSVSEYLFRINPWRVGRVGVRGGGGWLYQCTRITAFRASDEIQITNARTKCPGKHSAFGNILLNTHIFAGTPHSALWLTRFHSLYWYDNQVVS